MSRRERLFAVKFDTRKEVAPRAVNAGAVAPRRRNSVMQSQHDTSAAVPDASAYDRRRTAAIKLGASPTRCQGCTFVGDEVAWSDMFSAFLCLACYERRAA